MRSALSAPETATGPWGPLLFLVLAETVRFELTDPCGSAVFKFFAGSFHAASLSFVHPRFPVQGGRSNTSCVWYPLAELDVSC